MPVRAERTVIAASDSPHVENPVKLTNKLQMGRLPAMIRGR